MRVFTAVVFVVVVAAAAAAQTVDRVLDLDGLGWGPLDVPQAIEVDGDFATREWLIRSVQTNALRVVAETPAGLCAGAWFWPQETLFDALSVQRVGTVHHLLVRPFGQSSVRIVRLQMPQC